LSFSIVVPNYNGEAILPKYLPSILAYADEHGIELIVVDDCSTDGSVELLRESFPSVKVLVNDQNQGFSHTCNRGVEEASGDYVFLFNSDILINELPLAVIEQYLAEDDFFALTFKSLYPDTLKFREGAKRLKYKTGLPVTLHNPADQQKDAKGRWLSYYPVGGHCLVSKDRFVALGGFAACYAPFYWEDSDLGFRGSQRGWRTYYDERLSVVHDHKDSSIKSNNQKKQIDYIKLRNRFIFLLRNTRRSYRIILLYPGLTLRFVENLLKGRWEFIRAWCEAVKRVETAG
jgi:GT2 family glycosyltransferase